MRRKRKEKEEKEEEEEEEEEALPPPIPSPHLSDHSGGDDHGEVAPLLARGRDVPNHLAQRKAAAGGRVYKPLEEHPREP